MACGFATGSFFKQGNSRKKGARALAYVGVIVDIHHSAVDRIYHYRLPEHLLVCVGSRVVVPFGGKKVEGYVLEFTSELDFPEEKLKSVLELLCDAPELTEEQIETARFLVDYYGGTLAQALRLFLPAGTRYGKEATRAKKRVMVSLVEPFQIEHYRALLPANAVKMRTVLSFLEDKGCVSLKALTESTGASYAVISTLVARGMLCKKTEVVKRRVLEVTEEDSLFTLTACQEKALASIRGEMRGKKRAVLLHGVTGCGKTEVYLRILKEVLAEGKQAIVMVPEIALTPQTIRRFKSRFGEGIAVMHSGLSLGERFDEWSRIRAGEVDIVIGARSAVFAPLPRLGLLVLDEEHETTFKQEEGALKYHARTVALHRAFANDAFVILGSATPSLESYHKAIRKEYLLVDMEQRVNFQAMPLIERVDMRAEFKKGNRQMFSTFLGEALDRVLKQDEQAIIFLNRRGFASFLLCRECGLVLECKNCHVSLTYHQSDEKLHCHYCNAKEGVPSNCPSCGSFYLRPFGTGTEQVEEYVRTHFEKARIVRMDADTTSTKGAHGRLLEEFRLRRANVLIGTQMIAKGLDFPGCTLVGVLNADLALGFPDFRAGERTFQLLTQVAGRAGRGEVKGRVIIQCYDPEHHVLLAVENHDYRAFYRREISHRHDFSYPPIGHLTRILAAGGEEEVKAYLLEVGVFLSSQLPKESIFGPAPAPIGKIKGRYRYHILLKTLGPIPLVLRGIPKPSAKLAVGIDVEPQYLL